MSLRLGRLRVGLRGHRLPRSRRALDVIGPRLQDPQPPMSVKRSSGPLLLPGWSWPHRPHRWYRRLSSVQTVTYACIPKRQRHGFLLMVSSRRRRSRRWSRGEAAHDQRGVVVLGVEVEGAPEADSWPGRAARPPDGPIRSSSRPSDESGRRSVHSRRSGQTMLVRCSSIAPHTASSNIVIVEVVLGRFGRGQAVELCRCGVRPRRSQRLGEGSDDRGQQVAESATLPGLAVTVQGRQRARCRALPSAIGRGGDGVGVGQHDDPGAPLGHQHEPATRTRGRHRCGSNVRCPR